MPPRTPHRADRSHAADALGRVAPLVSRWMERLLANGEPPLTLAQYLTLRAVADGGAVGVELARSAGISASAVAQILAGLEEAGLLTRARASHDRRRQTLAPSEAGRRALRSADLELRRRLGALVGDLPPHEIRELTRILERLVTLLTGTPPPPHHRRPHGPRPHPHG